MLFRSVEKAFAEKPGTSSLETVSPPLASSTVEVRARGKAAGLITLMAQFNVLDLDVESESLEQIFMHYYGADLND